MGSVVMPTEGTLNLTESEAIQIAATSECKDGPSGVC